MSFIPRMPWGKYRGERVTNIKTSYLVWVFEESNADWDLRESVLTELRQRFGCPTAPPPVVGRKPCPDRVIANDLIDAGRKTLAKHHHPDHGGNTAVMQRVNATADWLKQVAS